MMTTGSTIDIKYVIKKNDVRAFSALNTHLEVKDLNGVRLINTPTVTAQVPGTSDGLVVFSLVALEEGGNRIKMVFSDTDDLDLAPVLIRLGSTYIRRLGANPTEAIL